MRVWYEVYFPSMALMSHCIMQNWILDIVSSTAINPLWTRDAIWRHWTWSAMVQIMALEQDATKPQPMVRWSVAFAWEQWHKVDHELRPWRVRNYIFVIPTTSPRAQLFNLGTIWWHQLCNPTFEMLTGAVLTATIVCIHCQRDFTGWFDFPLVYERKQ